MRTAPEPDPFGPEDALTDRWIAVLRLGLLPIAVIELPRTRSDLSVDLYPLLVGVFAVYAITFACAAVSSSISFACTSRDHGQRPMLAIDCSSMAMTATLSLGGLEVMRTPRS